jgi:hypothetical protein
MTAHRANPAIGATQLRDDLTADLAGGTGDEDACHRHPA